MWQKIFRGLMKFFGVHSLYVLYRGGYLRDVGWFRSFKEQQAVDANGLPIPWLPYPAIAFLSDRLRSEMTVFEYGCGNSTLWWADRVGSVLSCEHDQDWSSRIAAKAPANVTVVFRPLEDGSYVNEICKFQQKFDIIVVDGRERNECIKNSLSALVDDGIIILDDSFREEYSAGKAFLREHDFMCLEITGPAPIFGNFSSTAFFYRGKNCFNL